MIHDLILLLKNCDEKFSLFNVENFYYEMLCFHTASGSADEEHCCNSVEFTDKINLDKSVVVINQKSMSEVYMIISYLMICVILIELIIFKV